MWDVKVNGTSVDQYFPPDITKMEVELACRIEYGIQARLEITWVEEATVKQQQEDVQQ